MIQKPLVQEMYILLQPQILDQELNILEDSKMVLGRLKVELI